ncbi:MAG: hypothetical protein OZSIB_2459 [Candidatus Ozemobacter sibiricus]|uniref:Sel1 repeat family protein n=1 Tax=Candidatus Ozemobacter sibiricus TaxID=2268124 RepID=A0A367ZUN9_9BACT|nr:MAG: hypothetical protein OZSIB_2459 [Candidatus Ozemobacter sibiricus]
MMAGAGRSRPAAAAQAEPGRARERRAGFGWRSGADHASRPVLARLVRRGLVLGVAGLLWLSSGGPRLGAAPETASGVIDPGEIFTRMVAAAEEGRDPMLMLNVAFMLIDGARCREDRVRGVALLRGAAARGLPPAMIEYARMLTRGWQDVVEPDHAAAYAWMQLAFSRSYAAQEKRDLSDMLEFMQRTFSSEELAAGRRLYEDLERRIPQPDDD